MEFKPSYLMEIPTYACTHIVLQCSKVISDYNLSVYFAVALTVKNKYVIKNIEYIPHMLHRRQWIIYVCQRPDHAKTL